MGRDANLLVIELKKRENPSNREEDLEALEILTKQDNPFQYQLGLFLDIDCSDFSVRKSWFEDANRQDEEWIRIV